MAHIIIQPTAWATMDTEGRLERYRQADRWPVGESLAAMLDSQMAAYHAVRQALPLIEPAIVDAQARLAGSQGRLVYTGAGASARLAVQDGVELTPTFGWPPERIRYLVAGGDDALVRSIEGAEDDAKAGAQAIEDAKLGADDVLIAVAASGRTAYTIAALSRARALGSLTIAFANNAPSPLLAAAEHPITLRTGPEFLAGSTRMIAGTAQKIALNLFSTQLMMGLGHVHDGLMVDVQATNEKLRQRRIQIVQALTGCEASRAMDSLEQADGQIKLAVLLIDGCNLADAQSLLDAQGGQLGPARSKTIR